MGKSATRLLSLACVAAVVGLSSWLAPSKSYISIVNEELTRLRGPIARADALIMDLGVCLESLVDQIPTGQRVAIIAPNERIDRELHVALGAMGRVPSLLATSDWVIRELESNTGSTSPQDEAATATLECQGYAFITEKRRD
jgi:hypothetical protein